ncbi:hypothetical protein [Ralstonia chuxiongensis]|uniref:hypothetical protein n=1 Tax=Ralstonia chuxiongensis TaxID=2957504 RepID=UPI0028F5F968|nr:hypothetical protein [Ralstonia chuxiongensis]CAJ0777686.1 hypothetical protein R8510_04397 [Ralstonia chuxiongensis]
MSMTSGQLKASTLEELEAAYESLSDRRSYYGQALAELIKERRAELSQARAAKETGTEASND